jgi:hypothetical protein
MGAVATMRLNQVYGTDAGIGGKVSVKLPSAAATAGALAFVETLEGIAKSWP